MHTKRTGKVPRYALLTPVLPVLVLLLLLGPTACDREGKPGRDAVGAEDPTAVIAEAKIDYDRDGSEETLHVRMTAGGLREQTDPGPFMGQYREGEFRLELTAPGGNLLHAFDLNPSFGGEPLIFQSNRDFTIEFEDFNDDGYPDFMIGQYFSSNGFTYNMYTLKPDGIALLQQGLFTAAGSYSVKYEKAGNTSFRNRYYDMDQGEYVETLFTWQGERFVRTECEGCGMKAGETQEAQETEEAEKAEKADGGAEDDVFADEQPGDLKLTLERAADGFRLLHGERDGVYIASTHLSPPVEGVAYAVHTVRRSVMHAQETTFRRDVVVVNPASGEYRSYPLYPAIAADSYQADSVTNVYGFLDPEHILYVAVAADESRAGGYYYRVEKMNILTGQSTVLPAALPQAPMTDHFAPGWLNARRDTLVLNSYNAGQLWTIDLAEGRVTEYEGFSHAWPFFLTVPSPDGELFWYADYAKLEYRLYNLAAEVLGKFPFGDGYDQYKPFHWSPDSRYALYQDTTDQDEQHIVDGNGEHYIIAPQRIRFYAANGLLVRTKQADTAAGRYIEFAGWPDGHGDTVLLHDYRLEPGALPYTRAKTDSRYLLLDIVTGEEQPLQPEPDLSRLPDAVPARSESYQQIHWVDRQRGLVAVSEQPGEWLTEAGLPYQASLTTDYETGVSQLTVRDAASGHIAVKSLRDVDLPARLIGREWLVDDDMRYIRIAEDH